MSRLPMVVEPTRDDEQRQLLEQTERQLGRTPNLYRTMANAPVALQGYLAFREALSRGRFDARLREQLALAVASANGCDYCVAAHHLRATKIGIDAGELQQNRRGDAAEPFVAAVLQLAQAIVAKQGKVTDDDIAAARRHGLSDHDIAETVAHVALNTYSNWFNHVAEPDLDFPPAP